MSLAGCARIMVFLVVASFPSAQAAGTPSPDSSHASQQLHTYMEQAADAMHNGDLDVAAQNLRRALELDPHSLAALNNLGIVLSREGKPAEAIPLYQRALKVSPKDLATKRNLAVAYFKAERYHLGWSLLQPMAVTNPMDFQILDLAGLCLFAMDRYSEAAQYLERANQADPADAETLDMLGKAYLRTKNYKALTSVF
jgi:Flp pilus assembly protein TadD